jgi:CrcB protein
MNFLLVFFGGGLGAMTRYLLSILLPRTYHSLPLCTLASNFLGCFIASVVFTFLITKSEIDSVYKTLLITGFCGGLSTLSALSLEVMVFIQNGDYTKAGLYIFTSLLICIISVILGIILVKKYV